MQNDASIVNENNILDKDVNVLANSQQVYEHEMTDLSGENDNEDEIGQKEEHAFKYKVFVHAFDQCIQGSEAVMVILN